MSRDCSNDHHRDVIETKNQQQAQTIRSWSLNDMWGSVLLRRQCCKSPNLTGSSNSVVLSNSAIAKTTMLRIWVRMTTWGSEWRWKLTFLHLPDTSLVMRISRSMCSLVEINENDVITLEDPIPNISSCSPRAGRLTVNCVSLIEKLNQTFQRKRSKRTKAVAWK